MTSMHYCRWQNLAQSLLDILDDLDEPESEDEKRAMIRAAKYCKEIASIINVEEK